MDLSQTLAAVQRDIEQLATDAEAARAQCSNLQSSIDASKAAQYKLTSTIDLVAEEVALTLQEHSDMQCSKKARATAIQAMHSLRVKAKESVGSALTAALLELGTFESEAAQFQADYNADHLQQQAAAVESEHALKTAQLQAFKAEAAALHSKYKAVKAELARTQKELQERSQELAGLNKDLAGSKENLQVKQQQLSELMQQCRDSAQGMSLDSLVQTATIEFSTPQQSAANEQLCKELGDLMDESRARELEQALSDELASLKEEAAQTRFCIAVLQHEITSYLHPPPPQRQAPAPGGPRAGYAYQQQPQMPRVWQPATAAGGFNRSGPPPVLGHNVMMRSWPGVPVDGRPAMPTRPGAGLPNRGATMPVWQGQPVYTSSGIHAPMPTLSAHGPHGVSAYPQQYSGTAAAQASPCGNPGKTVPAEYCVGGSLHRTASSAPSQVHMQPCVLPSAPTQPQDQSVVQPVAEPEVLREPAVLPTAVQQGWTTPAKPGLQQPHTQGMSCAATSERHDAAQAAPSTAPAPVCSMYSVQEPDDDDNNTTPPPPPPQHDSTNDAPGTGHKPSMALVPHSDTSNSTYAGAHHSRAGALVTETVVTHTVRQSPSTVKQVVVVRQVVEGLHPGVSTPSCNTSSMPASPRLVMVHERVTEVRAVSPASHHTHARQPSPPVASVVTDHRDNLHGAPMTAAAQTPANRQTHAETGFMTKQGSVTGTPHSSSTLHHMAATRAKWLHQSQIPQAAGISPPAATLPPPAMHTCVHTGKPAVQTPAVQVPANQTRAVHAAAVQPPVVQSSAVRSPAANIAGVTNSELGSATIHNAETKKVESDVSRRDRCDSPDMDFSFLSEGPRAWATPRTQTISNGISNTSAQMQQQFGTAALSPGFAGRDQQQAGHLVTAGQQVYAAAPANNIYNAAHVSAASTPDNFAVLSSIVRTSASHSRHQPPRHNMNSKDDAVSAAPAVPPAHTADSIRNRQGFNMLSEQATAKACSTSTSSREYSSSELVAQFACAPDKATKQSQVEKQSRGRGQRRGAGNGVTGRGSGRVNERGATRAGKRVKTDAADNQPQVDMFGGGMAWTGL